MNFYDLGGDGIRPLKREENLHVNSDNETFGLYTLWHTQKCFT